MVLYHKLNTLVDFKAQNVSVVTPNEAPHCEFNENSKPWQAMES